MSEDVSVGTPGARKRTVAVWVAIGVLGVTGAVIAVTLNQGSAGNPDGSATPTPSVTATPAPAADPTEVGELDETVATDVIVTALAAPISTATTPGDLEELLKNVATDAYAAELEAQWLELNSQGWTVSGSPSLVSTAVTALDTAAVPTAQVTACLDSSAVVIADYAGDPIGDVSAMTPRALHLFTLLQGDDGIWRISSHTFPNDPTC